MPTRTPYSMLHKFKEIRNRRREFVIVNVGVGFIVSMFLTHFILPFWGYEAALSSDFIVTLIYTVAALIRNDIVARFYL